MVVTRPVDYRKGADSLAALVAAEFGGDPFSGVIYVFRAKRSDRIRLVWWDGTGLCLMAKRLEQGGFKWPRVRDGVVRRTGLSHADSVLQCSWKRTSRTTLARCARSFSSRPSAINPHQWLNDALTKLANGHPANRLGELMP
jgi:transposase